MKTIYIILLATLFSITANGQQEAVADSPAIVTDSEGNKVPQITWDQQTLDIGVLKLGEEKSMEFSFENTGSANLEIELVTACKCTTLDWPRKLIAPGEKGVIFVTYDSTDQKLGELTKTVDIIANTDPIVVEAFFKVLVIE